MQPIRKEIPSESDTRLDVLVCTEYSVSMATKKVVAAMHVEQLHRSKTISPLLDENGDPTGETQTTYGEWQPYRKYYPSGQYPVPVSSDNSKWVDAGFNLVEPGTEGAMGEVDALWMALENKLLTPSEAIGLLMDRMISRQNLDDLSQL